METINDIVREMHEFADTDSQTIGRDVLRREIHHFADRIKVAVAESATTTPRRNCDTKDWRKICADCHEGEPPKDCEYYGEPDGCNSPTYGEHPSVGNTAKMREAFSKAEVLEVLEDRSFSKEDTIALCRSERRSEMITPAIMYALHCSEVGYDVLADIRREDARKAQQRRNARKQRARELTRMRELEIKKAKGETDEQ